MDILLISPPSLVGYYRIGIKTPPLGLAYIAAVLREHGHRVKIIDLAVEKINWRNYPYHEFDLVGISADTLRYPSALKIAEAVKEKGSRVVFGGPHPTFSDKECLESGLVDWVVRGEGEYSLLRLVESLERGEPLEEVKSLSYLSKGKLVANPPAPFIKDLDSLPFPTRDLLPLDLYTHKLEKRYAANMITSRGCPFNCEFCSSSQFSGIHWRPRSPENILEELDLLHNKYGYRAVTIFDDNFTLNPQRVERICQKLLRKNWELVWYAESRVDTVVRNPRLIQLMAKAGLKELFLGFESASQEVLDKYGKKLKVEEAFKAMEILRRNKVKVIGAFILGALNENKEMIKHTIDMAKKLNPHQVQFTILTPYPGTRLYEKVKDRLLTKDWNFFTGSEPVIKLDGLKPKELKGLFNKSYLSFYGRPRRLFTQGIPLLYRIVHGYKRKKRAPFKKVGGDWVPVKR